MCGIFGFIELDFNNGFDFKSAEEKLKKLFLISESRGREAAGLAVLTENNIDIFKDSCSASRMLKSKEYKRFILKTFNNVSGKYPLAVIGHTRLVTNGFQAIDVNNQPIHRYGIVVVHNGIITNEKELWRKHIRKDKKSDLDSEVIPALIDAYVSKGKTLLEAVRAALADLEGEASIAMLTDSSDELILATNVGSIYYMKNRNFFSFVSEEYFARQLKEGRYKIDNLSRYDEIFHLLPGEILSVNIKNADIQKIKINQPVSPEVVSNLIRRRKIEDKYESIQKARQSIKRCTRCILPETMPFIEFDEDGVCNYCKRHIKRNLLGKKELEKIFSKHRNNKGNADCIVAFSGGRDSSYALHLIKKEFDMNPIAYTYDWGMVTGLARRNQARLTGSLGVEHIWVSADIKRKRKNISKNVKAWLKRPRLGMIPLFIAGDKQFFYYANKLMKHTNVDLMIFSQNPFEKTEFKTGFANVPPFRREDSKFYRIDLQKRIKLALYYGKEFLLNPRYINTSIFDTIFAYFSYYFIEQNYLFLYDYIPWNEEEVNKTLIDEYNWELSNDTTTTWRIGDGTAAFYNYIYYTVAGFTENDTLRSNQIREGVINREKALELVERENKPRWGSIREYLQLINLDFDEVIKIIDKIPKLYFGS